MGDRKRLQVYCETSFWSYLTGRPTKDEKVAHAVPNTEPTDAMHIATAAYHKMDVLLTWNCKHMANPVALPKTISTVTKAGYDCPVIITPEDFLKRKEELEL